MGRPVRSLGVADVSSVTHLCGPDKTVWGELACCMGVWGLCLGPVRTQQLQELGTETWLFLSAGGKQNRTWMKLWFCKQAWEQKQCSPVAVFAVYTANYRDSFSGASLCTLGSLIPSAPSRTLHLTNNLGSRNAATGKASSSSSCSAVLSRACTAWPAPECCTEDALGTGSAGCGTREPGDLP